MKLLYLSSWHGTLEYDELSLFTELGIDWFSTGLYLNPEKPSLEHAPKKPIGKLYNKELADQFLLNNPNYKIYSVPMLTRDFVSNFDVILVSHCCPTQLIPLQANWSVMRHKPVIWRTYTQQTAGMEYITQRFRNEGLKIIRISPKERTIPNYAGDDAIIRGHISDEDYYGWNGNEPIVLTFNNLFSQRTIHSNTDIYRRIREKMTDTTFELYGCDNTNVPLCLGELSWETVKQKYRNARVYFGLGSKPASLTYNILEAMMTGCPVITWGQKLGNLHIRDWANTYEMPEIIQNGINGFCSDDEYEIEGRIRELLNNEKLARSISVNARFTVISIFGKEKIKNDWKIFLEQMS